MEAVTEKFETALSKHRAANPAFARVYDECIDDMLPHVSTWPAEQRWGLLRPPSGDLILFLLQNGASPGHLAELIAAYSDADLPVARRRRLGMLLFRYEAAFCIEDGVVRFADRSLGSAIGSISACTCPPCAVAAGCKMGDGTDHIRATRRRLERRFALQNRAFDLHAGEVCRLDGTPCAS